MEDFLRKPDDCTCSYAEQLSDSISGHDPWCPADARIRAAQGADAADAAQPRYVYWVFETEQRVAFAPGLPDYGKFRRYELSAPPAWRLIAEMPFGVVLLSPEEDSRYHALAAFENALAGDPDFRIERVNDI